MLGYFWSTTPRQAVLVVLGATLFTTASFGGWTLWSHDNVPAAPEQDSPQVEPVRAEIGPAAPRIAEAAVAPVAPTAIPGSPVAAPMESEPARKKEPLQGKNHERQDALLASMAQHLHSEAYQRFIDQPGMGMYRMMPTISVMPRAWKMPEWTSEELAKMEPPKNGAQDLDVIHRLSLKKFAASNTKPQAKQPDAPELKPESRKDFVWEIKALDLVGLVVHETPVVYVSEKIPAMKDLKTKPTREMDVFESEGLEELASGKGIYIRSKEGTIRVLGPIHAAKTCLKCHSDVKEGALLGAFSYTLRQAQYTINGRNPQQPAFRPVLPKNGGFAPPQPKK